MKPFCRIWPGYSWTFGELSRTRSLQALQDKALHLLAFEAQWPTQAARANSRNEKGDTVELFITAGLDQGDWFSPVASALTLPVGRNPVCHFEGAARHEGRPTSDGTDQCPGRPDFGVTDVGCNANEKHGSDGNGRSWSQPARQGGLVAPGKGARWAHHCWEDIQRRRERDGNELGRNWNAVSCRRDKVPDGLCGKRQRQDHQSGESRRTAHSGSTRGQPARQAAIVLLQHCVAAKTKAT